MFFYSNLTGGFYTPEIHGEKIPSDAVEVSEEERNTLLEGQTNGLRIVSDSEGKPILAEQEDHEPTADDNKMMADRLLSSSDWVNQPDVYDTANIPHLRNRQEFLTYRSQLRSILVNPSEGNISWPLEPTANWAT